MNKMKSKLDENDSVTCGNDYQCIGTNHPSVVGQGHAAQLTLATQHVRYSAFLTHGSQQSVLRFIDMNGMFKVYSHFGTGEAEKRMLALSNQAAYLLSVENVVTPRSSYITRAYLPLRYIDCVEVSSTSN